MICAYNYTEEMHDTDITDAYLEFHWSYYSSVATTFLLFLVSWKICSYMARNISRQLRDQIRNARLPDYWIMICALLVQHQYPAISRVTFSALSVLVSVFTFITIDCFMRNMLNCELVSITKPAVIQTYQDAIDKEGLKLMFFTGWDEEGLFMNAEPGTKENEIWKKAMFMDDINIDSIKAVWQPIMDQKVVFLLRDWLGQSAANLGLTKMRELGVDHFRAVETKDETGKFFTNAFMILKDAPETFKEYITKR